MKRALFGTSQRLSSLKCGAWACVASGALLSATGLHAQVESLEPNPLEPAGAGAADVLEFRGGSSAGAHLGRTPRGESRGAEENPAETMLGEIDGTNYGRRTGHAALHGGAVRPAPRNDGRRQSPSRGGKEPVYSSRRGGYDQGRYAPRSRYRQRAPQRAPAVRTKRQHWF